MSRSLAVHLAAARRVLLPVLAAGFLALTGCTGQIEPVTQPPVASTSQSAGTTRSEADLLAAFAAQTAADMDQLIDEMARQGLPGGLLLKQRVSPLVSVQSARLVARYEIDLREIVDGGYAATVLYLDDDRDGRSDTVRLVVRGTSSEPSYDLIATLPRALGQHVAENASVFEYMDASLDGYKHAGENFPAGMTYRGGLAGSRLYRLVYDDGSFIYSVERLAEDPFAFQVEIAVSP